MGRGLQTPAGSPQSLFVTISRLMLSDLQIRRVARLRKLSAALGDAATLLDAAGYSDADTAARQLADWRHESTSSAILPSPSPSHPSSSFSCRTAVTRRTLAPPRNVAIYVLTGAVPLSPFGMPVPVCGCFNPIPDRRAAEDFELLGKERLRLAQLARDEAQLAVAVRGADGAGLGGGAALPPPPPPTAGPAPAPVPAPDDDPTVATFLGVIAYLSTDVALGEEGLFRVAGSKPAVDRLFERLVAEDMTQHLVGDMTQHRPGPVDLTPVLAPVLDPNVVAGTFTRLVNVGRVLLPP